MRTDNGYATSARALAWTLLIAGCSGDTSSPIVACGGRGQPRCGSGAGAGGDDGAGNGAGGSSGSDSNFGNTDASAPDLPDIDAGPVGPGQTTNPDDPLCGGLEIEPEIEMTVIPGNILFVFDSSGSMRQTWDATGNAKWIDARSALTAAITPLQDSVTVGSIFFPVCDSDNNDACNCSVPQISQAPQMGFGAGPAFLTAWDTHWNAVPPPVNGRTPLLEGLQAADAALNGATLTGTTHVVVITDGEPNCAIEDLSLPEKISALTALPAAWLANGIKTTVVGLPGAGEGDAIMLLNAVANAGGTTMHLVPSNPAALQAELAAIIGSSVMSTFNSCRIGLPEAPPDPEKVHVVVVENGAEMDVARDLGTGGGWALAADGSEIVLQGLLCDLAQAGQYEKISVVFGCVDVPPLPPPMPPE